MNPDNTPMRDGEVVPQSFWSWMQRAIDEFRKTINATLAQWRRVVQFVLTLVKVRALNSECRQSRLTLGRRAYDVGVGDSILREQVAVLDERTKSMEAGGGSTRSFRVERTGLLIRLADKLLESGDSHGELAPFISSTQSMLNELQVAEESQSVARRELLPSTRELWSRVIVGFSVPVLVLWVGFHSLGRSDADAAAKLAKSSDARLKVATPTEPNVLAKRGATSNETKSRVKVLPDRFPDHLTKYDLTTDLDIFYTRYLSLATVGDRVSDWPLVKDILRVSSELIDAGIIAEQLNEAVPVSEQDSFANERTIIKECAKVLGVDPPKLLVKQGAAANAYVTRLNEPHLLVISSRFHELYKDRPDELRFVIGHELGHLKCEHLRHHLVARELIKAIVGDRGTRGIRQDYIAPLLVNQLMLWSRESELSADRAGLVCIGGRVEIAQQALYRLMHGTNEELDVRTVEQETTALESEPFVKIARRIKSSGGTHPFVPDRILALKQWVLSSEYERLVNRGDAVRSGTLVVEAIEIQGLPETDLAPGTSLIGQGYRTKCDPIVRVICGSEEYETPNKDDDSNPLFKNLAWRFPYVDNARIFVEVKDRDPGVLDGNWEFVGSVVLAVPATLKDVQSDLRLSVINRSDVTNLPRVTVRYHIER